jgi:large subunit ribosomal protein L29
MKAKAKEELKAKSADELGGELAKARETYFKMRFRHQTAPLKNPLELRTLRRQIARLETLVRTKKK